MSAKDHSMLSEAGTEAGEPRILRPREMLEQCEIVNVLAPLVRCSKLPFRHLVSEYDTHITTTPMILAEEFSRSQTARLSDFSTSSNERGVFWMRDRRRQPSAANDETDGQEMQDRQHFSHLAPRPSPSHQLTRGILIAQFASPNGKALADSVELISPSVDGIDLNCGCPQPWAYSSGIGSALLRRPELVADMVRAVKDRMGWDYDISVKIRVDPDLKLTDQLVQSAIHAGASHLTIHGRTRKQASTHPVDLEAIKFAVDAAKGEVPCVGNGDIWDLKDAVDMRKTTGVRGVMAARGLLANPALFAGYDKTPDQAVQRFVDLSVGYGLIYPLFSRHVSYMLESRLSRSERLHFNSLVSHAGIIDTLRDVNIIQ